MTNFIESTETNAEAGEQHSQLESSELVAPYTDSDPTIDGEIETDEWSDAGQYTLLFQNHYEEREQDVEVYVQHNGESLYVAVDNKFDNGWDNNTTILFDGNADGNLDGSGTLPHRDVLVSQPAPSGWSGYDNYKTLGSGENVGSSDELEKASSSEAGTVTYEFKIPLRYLGVEVGGLSNVLLRTHTPDHGKGERFYWPVTPQDNPSPSDWASVTFQNQQNGPRNDLRTISYGETKSGELDEADPTRFDGVHAEPVQFDGAAGDEVHLQIESGELSGVRYGIEDPSGTVFYQYSTEWGTGTSRVNFATALLSSGTYTFWVASYPNQEYGEYTLSLRKIGAGHRLEPRNQTTETLSRGDIAWQSIVLPDGALPLPTYLDLYRARGTADQKHRIIVRSSDFTPKLFVAPNLSFENITVAEGGNQQPAAEAQLEYTLSRDGSAEIGVTATEQNATGRYAITVEPVGESSSTTGTTEPTPTTTTSNSTTRTTITSPTSTTPTTLPTLDYALEEGSTLEVNVGYDQLYVITEMPDTDPSRRAVTSQRYELVDPDTSRDALLAETYAKKDDERGIFQSNLTWAKDVRGRLKIQEYVNRASDIGLSLLQSYALAHLSPLAAVPEAVDAVAETIDWTVDELNDPYKQSFTALANSSKNLRWMDAKSSGIRSTAEFTDDIQYLVNKSVGLVSLVNDVDDITTAWKQVITAAASSSDEVAQSLYTKVSITAAKGLAGVFANIALDHTLEPMENWFRMNAEVASLMHAYNTVRIPVLKELIAVEKRAQNASLTPTDFIRYHTYRFTLQQLRALAFSYSARRYRGAIQGGGVKGLLTVLDNGAEKMNTHTRIAENGRRRAMWEFAGLGAGWSDVDRKLTNSINMEAYETQNGGNR